MDYKKEYERWCACATADADVAAELKTMDPAKVEDAFCRDLPSVPAVCGASSAPAPTG